MATTDRHFDDAQVLAQLDRKFGLIAPKHASHVDIDVQYAGPISNGPQGAQIIVKFVIDTDSNVADEVLGL